MNGSPRYLVRIEEQDFEYSADDIAEAIEAASGMYDPSMAIPEIVDPKGVVMYDPATMAGKIMDYRATHGTSRRQLDARGSIGRSAERLDDPDGPTFEDDTPLLRHR